MNSSVNTSAEWSMAQLVAQEAEALLVDVTRAERAVLRNIATAQAFQIDKARLRPRPNLFGWLIAGWVFWRTVREAA